MGKNDDKPRNKQGKNERIVPTPPKKWSGRGDKNAVPPNNQGKKYNTGVEYHANQTWSASASCKGCGESFSESSTVSQLAANDAVKSAFEQHVQEKHRGPLTGK